MSSPYWFPDWTDATVVIIACGPSLTADDVAEAFRDGVKTIAINDAWTVAPNADVLYACDWTWWAHKAPHLADFKGMRVRGTVPAKEEAQRLKPIQLNSALTPHPVRIRPEKFGRLEWSDDFVANGGNSAFQAANLAARWGAWKVILLGVDCIGPNRHFNGGKHTFPGAPDQSKGTIDDWLKAWRQAADQFRGAGVDVINASPASALVGYRKLTIREALA